MSNFSVPGLKQESKVQSPGLAAGVTNVGEKRVANNLNIPEKDYSVEWYDSGAKNSVNLPNEFFINFVKDDKIDRDFYAQTMIERFNEDASFEFLKDPSPVKLRNKHVREKEILSHYFGLDDTQELDHLVKYRVVSNFADSIQDTSGAARVVAYRDTNEHAFKIIFLDPYHLFLPSKHKGVDKAVMMKQTYQKHSGCHLCLSKCIKN
ncbi:hypothetical protein [Abiotrophia sp. HMSC24B09]|uniref:hypothetical protein n=1 Tax=Abiotrophia sp. HMSC24B09 TaxID=1581061 RepID=UPI0008A15819|nr:hypothetical protein [Abiotrophia sp. HMSC24B09]OFS28791.1 hypothetical protein HMPREF3093_06580 [Abiotrophia sp. HMSC24B09]